VVSSWERDLFYLATYLSYPRELQLFIYTTNTLERFAKEVKRRAKMIESFSHPEAEEKVLLMVTEQMNGRYRKRILPNWHLSKSALEKIRNEKYGTKVPSGEYWLRHRRFDTKLFTLPMLLKVVARSTFAELLFRARLSSFKFLLCQFFIYPIGRYFVQDEG